VWCCLDDPALEQVLEAEALVYEEDNPILDRIEPGEAPLDPGDHVHTPADRYTLEYRGAFIEFAGSQRPGRYVSDGVGWARTLPVES
jgi:hypothetical protein